MTYARAAAFSLYVVVILVVPTFSLAQTECAGGAKKIQCSTNGAIQNLCPEDPRCKPQQQESVSTTGDKDKPVNTATKENEPAKTQCDTVSMTINGLPVTCSKAGWQGGRQVGEGNCQVIGITCQSLQQQAIDVMQGNQGTGQQGQTADPFFNNDNPLTGFSEEGGTLQNPTGSMSDAMREGLLTTPYQQNVTAAPTNNWFERASNFFSSFDDFGSAPFAAPPTQSGLFPSGGAFSGGQAVQLYPGSIPSGSGFNPTSFQGLQQVNAGQTTFGNAGVNSNVSPAAGFDGGFDTFMSAPVASPFSMSSGAASPTLFDGGMMFDSAAFSAPQFPTSLPSSPVMVAASLEAGYTAPSPFDFNPPGAALNQLSVQQPSLLGAYQLPQGISSDFEDGAYINGQPASQVLVNDVIGKLNSGQTVTQGELEAAMVATQLQLDEARTAAQLKAESQYFTTRIADQLVCFSSECQALASAKAQATALAQAQANVELADAIALSATGAMTPIVVDTEMLRNISQMGQVDIESLAPLPGTGLRNPAAYNFNFKEMALSESDAAYYKQTLLDDAEAITGSKNPIIVETENGLKMYRGEDFGVQGEGPVMVNGRNLYMAGQDTASIEKAVTEHFESGTTFADSATVNQIMRSTNAEGRTLGSVIATDLAADETSKGYWQQTSEYFQHEGWKGPTTGVYTGEFKPTQPAQTFDVNVVSEQKFQDAIRGTAADVPANNTGREFTLTSDASLQPSQPTPFSQPSPQAPSRPSGQGGTPGGSSGNGARESVPGPSQTDDPIRYAQSNVGEAPSWFDMAAQAAAIVARGVTNPKSAPRPVTVGEVAKSAGTPAIPGLEGKVTWLHPLMEPSSIPENVRKEEIVTHQMEGGTAANAAGQQARNPNKVGAEWYLGRDGQVYHAAPENAVPQHIREQGLRNDDAHIDNTHTHDELTDGKSVAVEFEGGAAEKLTEAQLKSWAALTRFLQERHGIPAEKVYAHEWIQDKDDRYVEGAITANISRQIDYKPGKDAGMTPSSPEDQAFVRQVIENARDDGSVQTAAVRPQEQQVPQRIEVADATTAPHLETIKVARNAGLMPIALNIDADGRVSVEAETGTYAIEPVNTGATPQTIRDDSTLKAITDWAKSIVNEGAEQVDKPTDVVVDVPRPTLGIPGKYATAKPLQTEEEMKERAAKLREVVPNSLGQITQPIAVKDAQGKTVTITPPATARLNEKLAEFSHELQPIYTNKTWGERYKGEVAEVVQKRQEKLIAAKDDIESGKLSGKALQKFLTSIGLRPDNNTLSPEIVRAKLLAEAMLGSEFYTIAATESGHATHKDGNHFDAYYGPISQDLATKNSEKDQDRGLTGKAAATKAWVRAWQEANPGNKQTACVGVYSESGMHFGACSRSRGWNQGTPNRGDMASSHGAYRSGKVDTFTWDDIKATRDRSAYADANREIPEVQYRFVASNGDRSQPFTMPVQAAEVLGPKIAGTQVAAAAFPDTTALPENSIPVSPVDIAQSYIDSDYLKNDAAAVPSQTSPFDWVTPVALGGPDPFVLDSEENVAQEGESEPVLVSGPTPAQRPATTDSQTASDVRPTNEPQSQSNGFVRVANNALSNFINFFAGDGAQTTPQQNGEQSLSQSNGAKSGSTNTEVPKDVSIEKTLAAIRESSGQPSDTPLPPGADVGKTLDAVRDTSPRLTGEPVLVRTGSAEVSSSEFQPDAEEGEQTPQKGTPTGELEGKDTSPNQPVGGQEGKEDDRPWWQRMISNPPEAGSGGSGQGIAKGSGEGTGVGDGKGSGVGTGEPDGTAGNMSFGQWASKTASNAATVAGETWQTIRDFFSGGNPPPTPTQPATKGEGNIQKETSDPLNDALIKLPGATSVPPDANKDANASTETQSKDSPSQTDTSSDNTAKQPSAPPNTHTPQSPATQSSGSNGFVQGGMSLLGGLLNSLFNFFNGGAEQQNNSSPASPQQMPQNQTIVGAIVANPSLIDPNTTTTLSWSSVGTDVGSSTCAVVTADFNVMHRGPQNGSITSPALSESTRFGLICNTKNSRDKLLNETLVRVRGDDTDPSRIFSPEQIAASQNTGGSGTSGSGSSAGTGSAAGTGSGGSGGQSGNPAPQDVRTCDPEQPIDSFIRCLCEAEPNPNGCSVPPGGLRQ